jgi:hypothetical protein
LTLGLEVSTHVVGTKDRTAVVALLPSKVNDQGELERTLAALPDDVAPLATFEVHGRYLLVVPRAFPSLTRDCRVGRDGPEGHRSTASCRRACMDSFAQVRTCFAGRHHATWLVEARRRRRPPMVSPALGTLPPLGARCTPLLRGHLRISRTCVAVCEAALSL